jgi:hypothetical protein
MMFVNVFQKGDEDDGPAMSSKVEDIARLAAPLKGLKKVDWEEIREVGSGCHGPVRQFAELYPTGIISI